MDADVLIVGGGVAGLATAWHLARAGEQRVVLVEREPILGSAASGQNAAILRTFSGDPELDALARAGAAFLERPPEDFHEVPLVDAVGLLLAASGATAARWRAHLAEDVEVVTASEARARCPHVTDALLDADLLLWQARGGRIDTAAVIDGLARGARRAGATMRTGVGVRRLVTRVRRAASAVVGVELADGSTVRAGVVVLAAGAWAGRLGREAGSRVTLRPTRRHLLVTAPDARIDARLPVVWSDAVGFYCRPESGGMLLCGCDLTDVDPERPVADDPEVKVEIADKAGGALRSLEEAAAAHFWHGLRTLTADDRFCLGPDPDVDGLVWAAGLGGHGMTCGVEIGRRVAASLALRGATSPHDCARLVAPLEAATGVAASAKARC